MNKDKLKEEFWELFVYTHRNKDGKPDDIRDDDMIDPEAELYAITVWRWIEQAIKEERESLKLEILESIKPMLIRAKISKDDAIAALQEYLSSKK